MASSRSEENVNLKHFQHILVSQCWWALQFYGLIMFYSDYGRCYSHWFFGIFCCYWQMLLPYCHYVATYVLLLADVVAMLLCGLWWMVMLLPSGWCYSLLLADVIAIVLWLLVLPHWSLVVPRGVPLVCFTFLGRCYCQNGWCCCLVFDWLMLLPCGWCYCH